MKTARSVVTGALCAWILMMAQAVTAPAAAAEAFSGNWTLMPSDVPGQVQFVLVHKRGKNHSQHSSDWDPAVFEGLNLAERGKRDVQFTITREAGRFDCEGYMQNGVGAGVYLFTADAKFAGTMRDIGFTGIDEEMQYAMATLDVTTAFAREMKAEKLTGLTTDKLIALRVFGVTPQFIREMRNEGLPMTDSDKVIAFRVHGIEVARVRELKKLGIRADENQLIAMQVHGASPEWIGEVRKMGYEANDVDQLIAMRVHAVTPEYIANLKARGVKDLSIDKLIQLRVHGIE